MIKNPPQCRRPGFNPWVGKICRRRKWQPTPVVLPGESQGQGSLMGCRLWVAQSRTRLKRLSSSNSSCPHVFPGGSDSTESACNAEDLGSIPGSGRSLEKEVSTHSSILVWRIPWTEEPGGLQSMGSQKSRTQLSDKITTMFLFYSSCPTEPVTTEAT